jgi:hypothetical protein
MKVAVRADRDHPRDAPGCRPCDLFPQEVAGATSRVDSRLFTWGGPVDHGLRIGATNMLKDEIASVVWYEESHRIEVNYIDSEPDYLEGEERIVREMAEDEGMQLVSTSGGIRRWVRPER